MSIRNTIRRNARLARKKLAGGARREVVRHVRFWLPSVIALVVGGSIAEAHGHWFLSLILTVGAFLAVVMSISPQRGGASGKNGSE
jgi:hypothetical protein